MAPDFTRHVTRVDDNTVRKRKHADVIAREVEAMQYVQANTSIPIPKILSQEPHIPDNEASFTMTYIPGVTLCKAWDEMTDEKRNTVLTELRGYVGQLRALPPPRPIIGSVSGGPVVDQRVNGGNPCGPFSSESDFNHVLLGVLVNFPNSPYLQSAVSAQSDNHEILFTHGDLGSQNILVDPEAGHVNAIIDWEMAGWMPEYWEYRKARYAGYNEEWWVPIVDQFIPKYEKEWAADRVLEDC
jgi:hypothetical protein